MLYPRCSIGFTTRKYCVGANKHLHVFLSYKKRWQSEFCRRHKNSGRIKVSWKVGRFWSDKRFLWSEFRQSCRWHHDSWRIPNKFQGHLVTSIRIVEKLCQNLHYINSAPSNFTPYLGHTNGSGPEAPVKPIAGRGFLALGNPNIIAVPFPMDFRRLWAWSTSSYTTDFETTYNASAMSQT